MRSIVRKRRFAEPGPILLWMFESWVPALRRIVKRCCVASGTRDRTTGTSPPIARRYQAGAGSRDLDCAAPARIDAAVAAESRSRRNRGMPALPGPAAAAAAAPAASSARAWRRDRGGCARRAGSGAAVRRRRRHRRIALGLLAADFAARPGIIIGTAGGRGQRLTLHHRLRGERIDSGGTRTRSAQQLIGRDRGRNQRHDRSRQRPRRGLAGLGAGVGRRRLARQRNRAGASGEQARDLALDIVGELACAGLREIDAVIAAELADLAFEVRALLEEAAGFVDKAVPDIDIGDAGLGRAFAIERIQEQHVRGALGAADRGQADPEHRHALGLEDVGQLLDLLAVELDPALVAEFVEAVRVARGLLRRCDRRRVGVVGIVLRQVGVGRLVVRLGGGVGFGIAGLAPACLRLRARPCRSSCPCPSPCRICRARPRGSRCGR